MYYLKATRNNGILRLENVLNFVDESLVFEEADFLTECKNLDDCEMVGGIVSSDIYDVLNNAYNIT